MTVRVFLGSNKGEEVRWVPAEEKNPHFLVVGTSGSGKTESLKAIVHELRRDRVPSLIIDFHNEYRDVSESSINLRNLTINPLEVLPGRRPQDVVYEVANILRKIFRLGDRQEALLRSCIRDCYLAEGIDILEVQEKTVAPRFLGIREHINRVTTPTNKAIAESLLSRIEVLFEINIFFEENTTIPFDQILSRTTAIELKDFPTEDVKAAIAEFFINKLVYHMYQRGRSPDVKFYCLVDEAHRLLYENSPLDRMLRESRKYGSGVILSSQRPTDFSETILANIGGLLSLQCNLEKDAKFIAKQMGIDFTDVLNLNSTGQGYLKLTSSPHTIPVQILSLQDRGNTPTKAPEQSKPTFQITPAPHPVVPSMVPVQPLPLASPSPPILPETVIQPRKEPDKRDIEIRSYVAKIQELKKENTQLEKELRSVAFAKAKKCPSCGS